MRGDVKGMWAEDVSWTLSGPRWGQGRPHLELPDVSANFEADTEPLRCTAPSPGKSGSSPPAKVNVEAHSERGLRRGSVGLQ